MFELEVQRPRSPALNSALSKLLSSGSGGGYGGDRGGEGKERDEDRFGGVPLPDDTHDEDALNLKIQKTWQPPEFKFLGQSRLQH